MLQTQTLVSSMKVRLDGLLSTTLSTTLIVTHKNTLLPASELNVGWNWI